MQDFINPKSMLTPGVAGSLMMFLVNGIVFQFPEVPPRYIALFLSFLIGGVVWFSKSFAKSVVLEKVVYWILNSLVIFVVGFGAANLTADATAKTSRSGVHSAQLIPLISTAFAQGYSSQGTPHPSGSGQWQGTTDATTSKDPKALEEKLQRERAETERLRRQLELLQREKEELNRQPRENLFFKRW